jgi:hypothetical protein
MEMTLLQTYKDGGLRVLWEQKTRTLAKANPSVSPGRCGEIVAAMLTYDLQCEEGKLDSKINPFIMTGEEEALYDWLYVEEKNHYRAELQAWSGTRTMLADTPDGTYEPEWMQYINMPGKE